MIKVFLPLAEKIENHFYFLRSYMDKANMRTNLINYISLTLLITFVSAFLSFLFALLFLPIFVKSKFLLLFLQIFLPLMVALSSFLLSIFYPINKAYSRNTNIESVLPYVIIHLSSIVRSGVPPYLAFKILSRFKEYGEAGKEFERVVLNMDNFGMNFVVALRDIASKTPSRRMSELLNGIANTTIAGGDLKSYLEYIAERTLVEWRGKRQRYIQRLSTLAEIYIGVVLSSPLMIVSLLSIMALISPKIAGLTITEISALVIYILVPSISIGFSIFLKTTEVEI
ncbi:MAG: type II secretion system F family protein [Candidatus Aenigmarchaeota archaeon]|nr:type II secretion system F family protein [Candidatus Aenigmarchaeota archaeon]MDW8149513.1 type II secretion system F family protein [Candidatus Aenigmarchaeota archaeon]